MQADFNLIRAFDFEKANVHLWIIKDSDTPKKYKANYVPTDKALTSEIKLIAKNEFIRVTEFTPYGYIAQNNENSCLSEDQGSTNFSHLKNLVDMPETEHTIKGIKDLMGAVGYVARFNDGQHTVYCVKKSTSSWKTSYSKKYINIVFSNGELSKEKEERFHIEKNFDFYCIENTLFITNKANFESLLKYKTPYVEMVADIQADPSFSSLFTDMQPLIDYVGNNSTHLRRMATVKKKDLFKNPLFLSSLELVNKARNLGINFDLATKKIIVCDQTAKIVMNVLLDHILISEVTQKMYEVPDAILIRP